MSNQSVYNKLTTIGNSVDSIRDLVGEDLKQNLDCATIEELPDLVKQAISNNRNYQGAYIFTYDADCELPPEGLGMNTDTGEIEGLPDGGTQTPVPLTAPVARSGDLRSNTFESEIDTTQTLYMSYATFNSRGAMTTPFKIKVQMSGVQGERGEDGIDGTVFEEIYLLGNETIPATPAYEPYTSDTPPYDPIYEKHWTRVPSGVTNDLPIEYYSKREFKNNEGSQWSAPVMWAQFGKIGRDGKGIEYIFCNTNGNIPIKPDTTKVPGDDEFNSGPIKVQSGGAVYEGGDDPQTLMPTQICWCSIRRQVDGQNINGVPYYKGGPFSDPTVGARYSVDGQEGGGRTVFAYCVVEEGITPSTPVGGSWDPATNRATAPSSGDSNIVWDLNPPSRNAGQVLWYSTCSFHSSGVALGPWSTPVRMTVDGVNGKDGDSIQFIYRLLPSMEDLRALQEFHVIARENGRELNSTQNSDEAPYKIDIFEDPSYFNAGGIDPYDWENINGIYTISNTTGTDEPSGIDLTNLVECVCTRTRNTDGSGSKWSDPVPWSVGGEDGVDGEGVEYIYTVTPKTMIIGDEEGDVLDYYRDCKTRGEIPDFLYIPTKEEYKEKGEEYYNRFLGYEFVPGISDDNVCNLTQEGYDEPQDVDVDQPYEWVAIRKKQVGDKDGNPNEYIGEWGDFSSPKLWNKFASDGRSSVMAYAFTRSNEPLNTILKPTEGGIDRRPRGGSFNNPIPDPTFYIDGNTEKKVIGSDSVPAGGSDDDIWMTSRFFSSNNDVNNDGETVDDYWSIPCKMTDRSDFQVEFVSYYEDKETGKIQEDLVPNPDNFSKYYEEAVPEGALTRLEVAERNGRNAENQKGGDWGDHNTNPVGMATCRLRNQKGTDGNVVKVKGETGKAGTSVNIIGTAYLETEGACENTSILNPNTPRILSNGRTAIYALYYCENTANGTMYKGLDPDDPENPSNVTSAGYYTYSDRYTLSTGDGWLINGELGVWDGDSFENVGQIQGPAGEADRLYIAFSDDDAVLEKDSTVDIDLTLKIGKYIGYCVGSKLSNEALVKASTYNGTRGKGQDGGGQEQIFLLTKENLGLDNSYKLTRDHGPAVPQDYTEKHDGRPLVDDPIKKYVSPEHNIKETSGDYKKDELRWSDIPLTPTEDYPFCGVVTRSTSNWKWKGENGFATLYSNYVTSGVDAIHLELSEDNVSVPLDMAGNIDADIDESIVFDLTATLYSGLDAIVNPSTESELIKYYYRFDDGDYVENTSNIPSPLFQIKKSELSSKPNKIYIKVEWKNGSGEKVCKINYGTALYELTVSKSVLHKDLSTGYLFESYDSINVYVKRGVNGAWIPASDTHVYCNIKTIDEQTNTPSAITGADGNAKFTGLSQIKDISNVEFYLLDKYNNQICNETVGVIANGKDGAWQEFIYRLYTDEVTDGNDELSIEGTPEVKASTTNNKGQKYVDPDYVPDGWFDDPQEVNYEEKYQYVSVRKRGGESGGGPFSTPTLWSRMDVNLQVHMPSESVIVYNSHEEIGLNPDKIVTINIAITENGNLVSPIQVNGRYDIALFSQTRDNDDTNVWELYSVTRLDDGTFEIKVQYKGKDIVLTGTSYNLDFSIVLKQAVLHANHTIRLTQGGGENAIHLELTEDNAVYHKVFYNDPVDSRFNTIKTTASLYDGHELVKNVTWTNEDTNCTAVLQSKDDGTCDITFTNIDVDKDDIHVKITGIKDGKTASKVFRIRVTEDHIWSLSFDKPIVNLDEDSNVKIDVLYDGTKQTALGTNKIKYTIGSEVKEYNGNLPFNVDLSSDRDEVVFELLDSNGKILDTEGIGIVYNGKGASYYTISANYETCVLKEGEEKTIYPVVRLVKDNEDSGEIGQLKDFNSTQSFYDKYNYRIHYSIGGNSYKEYYTSTAGKLTTENVHEYIFALVKMGHSVADSDPKFKLLITRVKDGDPGRTGKTPVIYPAGKYDSTVEYNGNGTSAPYVYTVDGNGNPSGYYIAYGNGKNVDPTSESNQISDPDGNNVPVSMLKWVPMNQFEAIYSDIGIFNTALVGKWVFYQEGMFSQDGINAEGNSMSYSSVTDGNSWRSEFTPNILFNAKTGEGHFGAGKVKLGNNTNVTSVGGGEVTGDGLVAKNSNTELAKLGNDGSGYLGSYTDDDKSYKGIQGDNTSLKLGNNLKITNDGFIVSDNLSNPTSYFKLSEWEALNGDKSQYLSFKASNKSGFRTNSDSMFGLAVYGTGAYEDHIDNTSHNGALSVIQGDSVYGLFVNGKSYIQGDLDVTGQLTTSDGTYTSSDERLKNFYDEIEVDLDSMSQINKKYFSYKDSNKIQIGVSAQEVQKLYPELVGENDGYLTVAYDKLSVIALKAIDVLHQDNLKLKAEIEELKKLIAR